MAGAATSRSTCTSCTAQGHNKKFNGQTLLASASTKGAAGNGDSWQPQFARAGKAVVFTSLASNLARGDANRVSDVYERTMKRVYKRGHHKGKQVLRFGTALVSATRAKKAGNGASSTPSVSDDGRFVAYQTLASNLLSGDRNGVSDVAEADMKGKRVKQTWVSKSKATSIGNGASGEPTISDAGEFVFFQSLATNLKPSTSVHDDANGVQDVFLWNRPSGNVSLESRDWENGYLDVPSGTPATSSRGNYVPFVTRSKHGRPPAVEPRGLRAHGGPGLPALHGRQVVLGSGPGLAPGPHSHYHAAPGQAANTFQRGLREMRVNPGSFWFDHGLRADPRETPAVERLGRGSKLKSLPTNSSPAVGGRGCAIDASSACLGSPVS